MVYLICPNREPEIDNFENTGIVLNNLGRRLLGQKVRIMYEYCYCHVFNIFKLALGEFLFLR